MKKFSVFLVFLPLCSLIAAGCVGNQRQVYQTLAVTQQAVEVAEATFKLLNQAGEITASEYDSVVRARARYQNAMNTALVLAQQDTGQLTPQSVYQLSIELIRLIERLDS